MRSYLSESSQPPPDTWYFELWNNINQILKVKHTSFQQPKLYHLYPLLLIRGICSSGPHSTYCVTTPHNPAAGTRGAMKEGTEIQTIGLHWTTSSKQTSPFMLQACGSCPSIFPRLIILFSIWLHNARILPITCTTPALFWRTAFTFPVLHFYLSCSTRLALFSGVLPTIPPENKFRDLPWSKPKMFKGQRNATSCIYMPGVLWRSTSGSSRGWTPSDRCQAKSDQGDLMLQLKSTCGCPVQPEKIPLFPWPTIPGWHGLYLHLQPQCTSYPISLFKPLWPLSYSLT